MVTTMICHIEIRPAEGGQDARRFADELRGAVVG